LIIIIVVVVVVVLERTAFPDELRDRGRTLFVRTPTHTFTSFDLQRWNFVQWPN